MNPNRMTLRPAPGELLGIPLSGRRVALQRLRPQHMAPLYSIATSPELRDGWPLMGESIAFADFSDFLWSMGRLQFAIIRRDKDEPIGVIQAIDEDPRSGTTDVAIALTADLWRAAWPLEAPVLFADFLFRGLGYRKLYISIPESVNARLGLGRRPEHMVERECVLTRHVWNGEDYEDLSIYSMRLLDGMLESAQVLTGNKLLTKE